MKDDEQTTPVNSACSESCRGMAAVNTGILQEKEKYMHYYQKGMLISMIFFYLHSVVHGEIHSYGHSLIQGG